MAGELIEEFNKKLKRKDLESLYSYIAENQLEEQFLQQAHYTHPTNELSLFALKVCIEKFKEKFGPELANRFGEIIYNQHPGLRMLSLLQLNFTKLTERDSESIKKLLDIASNKDFVVGTHITGGEIGDILNENGIMLTGHKFAVEKKDKNDRLESILQKNVTFFNNTDPISFITQISASRGYNNNSHSEYNDVMIVSIPKELLQEKRGDNNGVIKEENDNEYLNPEYILGFARVDIENGGIEGIHNNDKSRGIEVQEKENAEKWEERFEEWYQEASTPKFSKAMKNVTQFLNKILKGKTREVENSQDR